MDTRPWRLKLPDQTAWFDVDQQPVITLKEKFLSEAGAELEASAASVLSTSAAAAAAAADAKAAVGEAAGCKKGCGCLPSRRRQKRKQKRAESSLERFPLKCAAYRRVVANFERSDLHQQLQAAGFDPKLPTVWVAEGLCYYLSLKANEQLLRATAAASPRGSRLIATHIPAVNLAANKTCPAASPLARLFTVSVDDVVPKLFKKSGWGEASVSGDIGEVIAARCGGARCYYPYSLAYSRGKQLSGIENIVEAVRL